MKLNYGITELTVRKKSAINECWEIAIRRLERCDALYYADVMVIRGDLLNPPEKPYLRYKSTPIYKYYIKQYEEVMKL